MTDDGGRPFQAAPKPKTERELAAEAAVSGGKRSYDNEPVVTLEEASKRLCDMLDTKSKPALDMMQRMVANIAKAPAEPKYRKVRLSNPKISEALVHVPGARQYLRAIGWAIVDLEFLELAVEGDGVAQAATQVAAVNKLVADAAAAAEARRVAELAERRREAAAKTAKQKAEREAIKAQMARDRGEVAARGPAETAVAKKLPSQSGGTVTSAIFAEQEEAEGRRNAQ
jgi:preprotein translocase subunit SecD